MRLCVSVYLSVFVQAMSAASVFFLVLLFFVGILHSLFITREPFI